MGRKMELNKLAKVPEKAKGLLIQAFDENGNGQIDIEDVILKAMKLPGIKIDRKQFLRSELKKYCTDSEINIAIAKTPKEAGVSSKTLSKIADDVIKLERNKSSITSFGLASVPGELGVQIATTVGDITQFYANMLRVIQKILYLYGFPELGSTEGDNGEFDSATMNVLILSIGAMYGLQEAVKGIRFVAAGLAKGTEKALMKKALTKGVVYPFVKKTMRLLSVQITKEIFSKFVANSIVFVGGLLCGGITYFSFDSCCNNLKDVIQEASQRPLSEANEILEADFVEK